MADFLKELWKELRVKGTVAILLAVGGNIWVDRAGYLQRIGMSTREASAWTLVLGLGVLLVLLAMSRHRVYQLKTAEESLTSPAEKELPARLEPVVTILEPSSGQKGMVTIRHSGPPSTYRVEGRIIRVIGGQNPWEAPFACRLLVHNEREQTGAVLRSGEWANIVLAVLKVVAGKGMVLGIRKGGFNDEVLLPSSGALVELRVTASTDATQNRVVESFILTSEDRRLISVLRYDALDMKDDKGR